MTYNNFIEVPRLNYIQIEGVKAGLSREQVQTPNFCWTTVEYVRDRGRESFVKVAGLDYIQIARLDKYSHSLNAQRRDAALLTMGVFGRSSDPSLAIVPYHEQSSQVDAPAPACK